MSRSCAARARDLGGVDFIYTPVRPTFSIKYNGLQFTRPRRREGCLAKSVERFDTLAVARPIVGRSPVCGGGPRHPKRVPDRAPRHICTARKLQHVASLQCFGPLARVLLIYTHQRHSRTFGKQASQGQRLRNAGSGTKATSRTPSAPYNNEKTLLHTSKRPTTPPHAGFFFAARSSAKCPRLTSKRRSGRPGRRPKKEAAAWAASWTKDPAPVSSVGLCSRSRSTTLGIAAIQARHAAVHHDDRRGAAAGA